MCNCKSVFLKIRDHCNLFPVFHIMFNVEYWQTKVNDESTGSIDLYKHLRAVGENVKLQVARTYLSMGHLVSFLHC